MASTQIAANLTEAHRLAQVRISAETTARLRKTWSALDLTRLDATTTQWIDLALEVIRGQRQASAALAAQYVRFFRSIELGFRPDFTPELAVAFDIAAASTSLRIEGPVKIKQLMAAGAPLIDAGEAAFVSSASAASRHALNGGRDTIIDRTDRRLLGVARATSGRCCAFCAMLASRGPVYHSEESADFKAHNTCYCQPEPVYRADAEWPAGSKQFAELWQSSTKGYSGKQAINAFRRALP